MEQVLRNVPFTIQVIYRGADGTPKDLDNNPTVSAEDDQGNTVTTAAVTKADTGTYEATVDGLDSLTVVTATWTGEDGGDDVELLTYHEVVGAFLFALPDLDVDVTAARKKEARESITDDFGAWCGVDFIPRPRHEVLDGNGQRGLRLRWPKATTLTRVEIGGVSVATSGFHLYEHGRLERDAGVFPHDQRNVEVWYEAGYPQVPADIRRAALKAAEYQINGDTSTLSARATAQRSEFGDLTFMAGHKPTGLPDVDGVLAKYRIPVFP